MINILEMAKTPTQDKYFGSHERFDREDEVESSSNRSFGVVFAIIFGIVGGFSVWAQGSFWPYWLGASALTQAITLIRPGLLAPFNFLWTRFGILLSRVVSPVVLAMIFYLVMTPVGLMMRLCGKDPLRLKQAPDSDSYWIMRDSLKDSKEPFKNQF